MWWPQSTCSLTISWPLFCPLSVHYDVCRPVSRERNSHPDSLSYTQRGQKWHPTSSLTTLKYRLYIARWSVGFYSFCPLLSIRRICGENPLLPALLVARFPLISVFDIALMSHPPNSSPKRVLWCFLLWTRLVELSTSWAWTFYALFYGRASFKNYFLALDPAACTHGCLFTTFDCMSVASVLPEFMNCYDRVI